MKRVWVALLLLSALPLAAKPMSTPNLAEAVASPVIVVAQYLDFTPNGQIDYFNGPSARYRVQDTLKGACPKGDITVFYAFQDGSACMADKNWHFDKSTMPASGSSWILFLRPRTPGQWGTYRGNWGRWAASDEKLAQVKQALGR